eukprot:scaffold4476_cov120-Skeletonema_dohrnii-CCMP3373.AAC.18
MATRQRNSQTIPFLLATRPPKLRRLLDQASSSCTSSQLSSRNTFFAKCSPNSTSARTQSQQGCASLIACLLGYTD